MKPITHVKKTLLFLVLSFAVAGCATTGRVGSKSVLIEHPERFFWEIKGEKGSVYVLGTVHVADKTFFPLEKNILEAFDTADRLVSELGGAESAQAFAGAMQTVIPKNMNAADSDKNLLHVLSEDELAFLYEKLGDDAVQQFALFNPWILNLILTQLLLNQAGLNAEDGIDTYLIQRAKNKKIEALDTAQQQIAALSYGSFEDQLAILKDTIKVLQEPDKTMEEIRTLRNLYLTNDRERLSALLLELLLQVSPSFTAEKTQAYIDVLLTERNRSWARKFDKYLQAGGKTFVFAGAAHFLGKSSVFEIMRQKGSL